VHEEDRPEILETLDPANDGYVTYEPFLAYAALQLNALSDDEDGQGHDEEVRASYNMFLHNNGDGPITIAHLRQVARTIREEVDDDTLKDMIAEANGRGKGGWRAGVTVKEFEAILKRAGVLR
jgi:Ca2+-binding EF-hand superfamily protein